MSETKEKGRSVVKTVTHGKLYSDGTILVEDVRCSYPHVFKAAAFEGGEPSTPTTIGRVLGGVDISIPFVAPRPP